MSVWPQRSWSRTIIEEVDQYGRDEGELVYHRHRVVITGRRRAHCSRKNGDSHRNSGLSNTHSIRDLTKLVSDGDDIDLLYTGFGSTIKHCIFFELSRPEVIMRQDSAFLERAIPVL